MFTRTTGLLIVPFWLVAMSWLVAHDIWPGLSAQDPPRIQWTEGPANGNRRAQFAISAGGKSIGGVWTKYRADEKSLHRLDTIWVERLQPGITPLRVTIGSVFTADGLLDEFTVRLENNAGDIRLHGERFHAAFSFKLTRGPTETLFKIPLTDGDLLSGGLNPFVPLPGLRVGQRWRIQILNPVAVLTGVGDRFRSMLVEVTRHDTVSTPDGVRPCVVVESPGAKAWVDPEGDVLMQEMTLPIVGTIRLVREAHFDEDALVRIRRQRFPIGPSPP